ncbi:MAG: coenzyme F420 biosynthesis-associated protein, partial [Actinomycetales bacterium]|nr:coenzyme F420 biosynthesis-associated protein [Actinomycetales bacterium]
MIDWTLAQSTADRLTPAGPEMSAAEVSEVVAELRSAAVIAQEPVAQFTGLTPAYPAPVLVVDRPRWVEANLKSFEKIIVPFKSNLEASGKLPTGGAKVVGEKMAGAEMGALMSFMARRVLGQFDPFWEGPNGPGRLLLVAPNVVSIERKIEVDPTDFRQWVCLHEETHRAQFSGVPWMPDYLLGLVGQLADSATNESQSLGELVSDVLPQVLDVIRGNDDRALSDIMQNEEQRAIVGKVTGLMSLLEGHADVVMDDIGPDYVPSVAHIRRQFNARRASGTGLGKVIRRLMGLEA